MPPMKDVIRLEPSTSGYDFSTCDTVVGWSIMLQEGFAVLAIPTSIFVIYVMYRRRTNYLMTQTTMSQTTMNLNRMLMRALTIHMCIIIVFLVIPVCALYAIAIFGNEKYNILLEVMVIVFTCHSLVDIPAMLFFIKPYRKFMAGIFGYVVQKVGLDKFLKNDQVVVVQQVQSLTAINSSQNRA
uniref:G-protein coupled receptors family 1 profile domain-containing protein n=1 Tax=Acrobeloides nanus TaxID=290746 RepID=A0A914CFZ4_9BILA